jgi:rhamnosyltransferase subunit B
VRPDIDPENTALVAMIYDVKKGTERGLREFLFPALRQTYDDLLDAATKPERADLLLLGELNYAGPLVAEVTGIPWASYVLAPLSFFSAFDPPVLPMYPRLARADKWCREWAGPSRRGPVCQPQVAAADLRSAPRTGPGARRQSAV